MSTPPTTSPAPTHTLQSLSAAFLATEAAIKLGGGKAAIDRQHEKNRLTARERIALLIDKASGIGHQASGKNGGNEGTSERGGAGRAAGESRVADGEAAKLSCHSDYVDPDTAKKLQATKAGREVLVQVDVRPALGIGKKDRLV